MAKTVVKLDPESLPPRVASGFDRLMAVQRPVVLAHIRSIRARRPDASPAQIITILERRYLTAVTAGGAAVGASAVIPAVGTGAALALSGVETAGFLETSALFAQSVTEIHGIAITDPERARTLVMALILGNAGQDLIRQFAGQARGTGSSRTVYWGEIITSRLPNAAFGQISSRIRNAFLKRFAVTQGSSVIGRLLPFGIGAVVGGTGNHLMGRQIVRSSHDAFGPPPVAFPVGLEALPKVPKAAKASRAPRVPKAPKLVQPPAPAQAQLPPPRAEDLQPE
ncbi:MAG TPA: hypothetical protein VNT53_01570 [Pseudolysinimonas sp.]|nr:hypothetical protein [Pseudolysinimonas sp.]